MSVLGRLGRLALRGVDGGLAALERAVDQPKMASVQPKPTPGSKKSPVVKFTFGDPRRPAQLFGRRSCSWSGRAQQLLESAHIDFVDIDLDHPASGPMASELRDETGQETVPYVYLRGKFIGGYNALDEIQRLGQLEHLTLPETERLAHPLHGKIEIARAPSEE